jgi:hypothetical protein
LTLPQWQAPHCARLLVLTPVKILRLWLLVLLAVLLPVRGAMAGAMLCSPAGVGTQQELRTLHEHAADSSAQAGPHAGHHHLQAAHHDEAADPGHDKCNLCSAFCSLTPLLSDMPGVPPPLEVPAESFPDFSAPAPSFLSDGQERPPRSF